MRKEYLLYILDQYENALILCFGDAAEQIDYDVLGDSIPVAYKVSHILSMLPKMRKFVEEDRVEKAMRWLGFIQGVLFSCGFYTIGELRSQNYEKRE